MTEQQKYLYFASDLHLGAPNAQKSAVREKAFINWLDDIKPTAKAIYLLGDVFDFWFEYKTVVPKGYTRLLGKIAELSDAGIEIHYFKGNHDMWVFDYFQKELGLTLHSDAHTTNTKCSNASFEVPCANGYLPDYILTLALVWRAFYRAEAEQMAVLKTLHTMVRKQNGYFNTFKNWPKNKTTTTIFLAIATCPFT